MSSATVHSDSCLELLEAFLVECDRRVGKEQARGLVLTHKCKWCRTPFAELLKKSRPPVFMKDSRGVVHELCANCANMLWETDPGAQEIDLSKLEDDTRKIIFGIMVGELRHTQFKGEPKAQAASFARSEELGSSKDRKPVFVRKHPARRGLEFQLPR